MAQESPQEVPRWSQDIPKMAPPGGPAAEGAALQIRPRPLAGRRGRARGNFTEEKRAAIVVIRGDASAAGRRPYPPVSARALDLGPTTPYLASMMAPWGPPNHS